MKKLIIVALVAVAVLAFCAPAMAWPIAQQWWEPSSRLHRRRQDPGRGHDRERVTVRVHLASRGAADYLGEDLTVAVAADAQVFKAVGARLERITWATWSLGRSCASKA